MSPIFSTKRLCRAGVIAALYATLTYVFTPFAFGPVQIRPSEALCVLPLFFPEAIPALTVGCMLANLPSPYFLYDVLLGGLATFLSSFASYLVGRFCKHTSLRLSLGGLFPVLFNALILPAVILLLYGESGEGSIAVVYFTYAASIALTEIIWVYVLGSPLYFVIRRLQKRSHFLSD